MTTPKVSVIVPNYNHGRYLPQRLDSVLNQSFGDIELIVLDDASRDNSHSVLTRYYSKPRVRLVVNTQNSGSAFPQWNRGIAMAKGDYVWIAESDDFASTRFLETLVSLLDDDRELSIAYCQSRLVDTEGTDIGNSLGWTSDLDPTRWTCDFRNSGINELRHFLLSKNTVPNASAVLMRRSALMQVLPIDGSYKLCGDWLHWGKMLLRGDIAYTATPLNYWRQMSSNSRIAIAGLREWEEGQRVISFFAHKLDLTDAETDRVLLQFARRCLTWVKDSAFVAR